MAATRPLVITVRAEDRQLLELLADYRRTTATDLASWLVETWLANHGKPELLRRLAGITPTPQRRRTKQLAGQMTVDEAIAEG